MKKLILYLTAFFVVSALAFTAVPDAFAAIDGGTYVDFASYGGNSACESFKPVGNHMSLYFAGTDPESDAKRGTNAGITTSTVADEPFANWDGTLGNKSFVIGFSMYPHIATRFLMNFKFDNTLWFSPGLQLDIGKIWFKGTDLGEFTPDVWNDFRVVFDYETHTATLYVNGNWLSSSPMDESLTTFNYCGFNFLKTIESKDVYIDDFVMYPTDGSDIRATVLKGDAYADISLLPIPTNPQYIDVSLNSEICMDEAESLNVSISGVDSSFIRTELRAEGAYDKSFADTVRVYIDTPLPEGSTHTLSVSGIKSLSGKELNASIDFETEDNSPYIGISYVNSCLNSDGTTLPEGAKARFEFETLNIDADSELDIIVNGAKTGTVRAGDKFFATKIVSGTNTVSLRYADTESDFVVLDGIGFSESVTSSVDFESGSGFDGFSNASAGDALVYLASIDAQRGKSLYAKATSGDGAFAVANADSSAKGFVKYEYEAYFKSFNEMKLISAKCSFADGSEDWRTPFILQYNGKILDESNKTVATLETDKWYKLTVIYNIHNTSYSLMINDEMIVYEEPFAKQNKIARIQYFTLNINPLSSYAYELYLDNFKISSMTKPYSVYTNYCGLDETVASSTKVPFKNGKAELIFSEDMTGAEAKSAVSLYDSDGNKIDFEAEFDSDANTYIITLPTLKPRSDYKIVVDSSLRSASGGKNDGNGEFEFTTKKDGFYIDDIKMTESGADIYIQNDTASLKEAKLFVGVYEDNILKSCTVQNVSLYAGGTSQLAATVADGLQNAKVSAYLLDSFSLINVIDAFE